MNQITYQCETDEIQIAKENGSGGKALGEKIEDPTFNIRIRFTEPNSRISNVPCIGLIK